MAEYWKSAPKYWCKQCKIYIRDTAFERTQHEATGKHQGNLKRFLRDIHRDNERQQRDSQRAKDEVERLRQSVSGKPGDKPPWKSASSTSTAAAPAQPRAASVEERKRQMAQLADMGVAIPEAYRGDMALAGDWQTVSEKVIRPEDSETQPTLGVRKRKHELDEEEEEAKREAERFVSKAWGSATRQYPGAQEDGDLDTLLASTKEVKKTKISGADHEASGKDENQPHEGVAANEDSDQPPKLKEEEASGDRSSLPAATNEPDETTTGIVFKKRKPKAMRK
ncbi:putative formin binding protein [Aspergillus lucknowensis]|uniref:U1-type domain-containing protein n=1 Tax=Aspergillus lucknowensis TaxID=176173 RepID=A0ABR4LZ95_9EURO